MFRRLRKLFRKKPPVEKNFSSRFDARSEKNIATLNSEVQPTFRKLTAIAKRTAARYGCEAKVISGHRTYEEQAELYAKGRTAPGPRVTNARPGYSNHNFGVAVDFGIFSEGDYLDGKQPGLTKKIYRIINNVAETEGLNVEWGGSWKGGFVDPPHFEYITPWTLAEMRDRTARGLTIV